MRSNSENDERSGKGFLRDGEPDGERVGVEPYQLNWFAEGSLRNSGEDTDKRREMENLQNG
jgi:hypothetical protein